MAVASQNFDRWFDGKVSFSGRDGGVLMEVKRKEEEEVEGGRADWSIIRLRCGQTWSKAWSTLVNNSHGRGREYLRSACITLKLFCFALCSRGRSWK